MKSYLSDCVDVAKVIEFLDLAAGEVCRINGTVGRVIDIQDTLKKMIFVELLTLVIIHMYLRCVLVSPVITRLFSFSLLVIKIKA